MNNQMTIEEMNANMSRRQLTPEEAAEFRGKLAQLRTRKNAIRKLPPQPANEHGNEPRPDLDIDYATRRVVQDFEVTPELAAAWLKHHGGKDRGVNWSLVEEYARDMPSWDPDSCDAIGFTKSGQRVNGQKRLHACVKSGCPFRALVRFGLKESVLRNTDQNQVRGVADQLEILHRVQSSKRFKAIAQTVVMLETGIRSGFTFDKLEPFCIRERDNIEWVMARIRLQKGIGIAPIAAAIVYALPVQRVKVETFVAKLLGEVAVDGMGDPANTLQAFATRVSAAHSTQQDRIEISRKAIRALYACVHNEKLKLLKTEGTADEDQYLSWFKSARTQIMAGGR